MIRKPGPGKPPQFCSEKCESRAQYLKWRARKDHGRPSWWPKDEPMPEGWPE